MTDAASALLSLARDTLDDARLLAEHRRRNEAALTRLALHQALQAISLAQGLDADDGLRLDTLFKRVPDDHPEAARIAGLRQDPTPTIAAVAALVQALAAPPPAPSRRPFPAAPSAGNRSRAAEPASTARSAPDLSGPTALALSPQRGRAEAADSVSSAAFWALMDRWRVSDLDALALIGHAGGLTRKGTRPRFRLEGDEAARYAALRRLDTALETLRLDPAAWLATPLGPKPHDDPPLALLHRDGADGARQLLHALNRQGLAAGLKQSS